MPIETSCPSCNRKLRVPDELLGKKVKCPSCATVFTAADADEPPDEPAPPPKAKKSTKPLFDDVEDEPRPKKRRPPPEEEEEDDDRAADEEEEEEEERPRRRRRDEEEDEEEERPRRRPRRGSNKAAARAAVAAPAVGLMVIGVIGLVIAVLALLMYIYQAATGNLLFAPQPPPPQFRNPGFEAQQKSAMMIGSVVGIVGCLISLVIQSLILMGGLKMKNLESRGLAFTSSILALICSPCCIGLPIGIWALVVLNRPDVSRAFS